jgi:hypothetical protein
MVAFILFYHIYLSTYSLTLPMKLRRAYVLCLKLVFMPQRLSRPPMITWDWLNFFLKQSDFGGVLINQRALVGGVSVPRPLQGSAGASGSSFFFYHIYSPSCSCTLLSMLGEPMCCIWSLHSCLRGTPGPPWSHGVDCILFNKRMILVGFWSTSEPW